MRLADAFITRCLYLSRDSLSGRPDKVASGADLLLLLLLFPSCSYSMRVSTFRPIYLSFRSYYEKTLAVLLLFSRRVYCW